MTADHHAEAERIAALALTEDGASDVTTDVTVASGLRGAGVLELRTGGVFAGAVFAEAVARQRECTVQWNAPAGSAMPANTDLGIVRGRLADILRAERPLLNILQRACGVATITRTFADAVAGTSCRVLHTRKTAPGLRALDVDAVIAGGGGRHRIGLADQLMVKDNHWQALRREQCTLANALAAARARGVTALYVEVESLEQLEEACAAGATRLLIDNQTPDQVRTWAAMARDRAPGVEIEATGGITLRNARAYADAGADFISIGALTHSVVAADIALEVSF